jgi:hypothetical protein
MQCPSCLRELTDDAPIHRVSLSWFSQMSPSIIRYRCDDCCAELKYHTWRPPIPCAGCGRPVIHDTNREPPQQAFCGNEQCRRAARAAAARELRQIRRRRRAWICRCCGEKLNTSRSDGRYCSPACRQRAYRQRAVSAEAN